MEGVNDFRNCPVDGWSRGGVNPSVHLVGLLGLARCLVQTRAPGAYKIVVNYFG